VVVLGAAAADRLGIVDLVDQPTVFISSHRFTVVGILDDLPYYPALDNAALLGYPVAAELFGVAPLATSIFARVDSDHFDQTRAVIAQAANPLRPSEVEVSRPSEALIAAATIGATVQAVIDSATLLGPILVAVFIAVVAYLGYRRRAGEIGQARAMGATRADVATEALIECAVLSVIGSAIGVAVGLFSVRAVASARDWVVIYPVDTAAIASVVAVVCGVLAGLVPAAQAAFLDPALAVKGNDD